MVGLKDCIRWKFPMAAYGDVDGCTLRYYIQFVENEDAILHPYRHDLVKEGTRIENEWVVWGALFDFRDGKERAEKRMFHGINVENELKRIHGEGCKFHICLDGVLCNMDLFDVEFDL
jgi:hypothetical protein